MRWIYLILNSLIKISCCKGWPGFAVSEAAAQANGARTRALDYEEGNYSQGACVWSRMCMASVASAALSVGTSVSGSDQIRGEIFCRLGVLGVMMV